ncbi:unnamed protein product [Cuscuta europaea]|uniref:Leucine-rich repeat-containing N-terminal plant-type domain-containing protein n=1 Tax=Cuscuta europaea TaxID=41803 RepID=A0A9P1EGD1_CUSEU|nr:unnamed protein product [Cuscuta europaea]
MGNRVMASSGLLLLFAAASIAVVVRAQYGPSPDDDVLQTLKSSLTLKNDTSVNLSDVHPCNWTTFLECDVVDDQGTLRVTILRFYGEVANGSLPANLENLTKLDEFEASSNNLVGAIPNFTDSVGYLSFEDNQFTSISPGLFDYKPNLTSLYLSNNAHLPMWEIPQGLKNSSKLQQFHAANCNLFGEIPDLSNLQSLQELDVSHNQLTSIIPPSLANLSMLITVDVSHNQLTGVIPPSLAGLSQLETVDVSNNQFTGVIPQTLADLPYLTKVDLSNNNLTGTVPEFKSNVTVNICGNPGLLHGRGAPCNV